MSAESLLTEIVSNLDGNTSAAGRVFYGQRIQLSSVPAITFEIVDATRQTLGNNNTVFQYTVTFNAIANTLPGATALDGEISSHLALNTNWVLINTQFGVVQETQPEAGEETGLYICSSQFTIYQTGP